MFSKLFSTNLLRKVRFSNIRSLSSLSNTQDCPGRAVFISQSNDVFSNLALEDWFYKKWDFSKRQLLFFYINNPCVVVGRHQNPYVETNLDYLNSENVPIIRRNSGGGTVYHDGGNLNLSFFTSRDKYNRRLHLDVICESLEKDFNVTAEINKKDDIIIGNQYKLQVSGSAAKLGRLSAYHHCTLLVSADKSQMKIALNGDKTMESRATRSIPSPVANLSELNANITVQSMMESVGRRYMKLDQKNLRADGFQLISPTEDWFPGLTELRSALSSWQWQFGMTPSFKKTQAIAGGDRSRSLDVTVEAYHGIIKSVSTSDAACKEALGEIGSSLEGQRYDKNVFNQIEDSLRQSIGIRDSVEEKRSSTAR